MTVKKSTWFQTRFPTYASVTIWLKSISEMGMQQPAPKALVALAAEIKESDVFAVDLPNKIGEWQKIAKKTGGAGVNILYMHGTTGSARSATCIFSTSDDVQAIQLINRNEAPRSSGFTFSDICPDLIPQSIPAHAP